ncbi:MAG: RDD family protein [Acidobacteria bacterium]|nr:RDD family protein [Acidobacteriota bacterium]
MSYGGNQPGGGYPPPGGYQPGGGFPPPQQQGGYGAPAQYADIGKRFVAALLDGLIVSLGTIPGVILIFIGIGSMASQADAHGRISDEAAGAGLGIAGLGYGLIFLGYLGVMLYNVYLLGRDGATLGKRWMKIRVLDPQGQPVGFGKAFLRELVKGALGGICAILLLWPLWDQEKQGLWDKVSSTHVYNA